MHCVFVHREMLTVITSIFIMMMMIMLMMLLIMLLLMMMTSWGDANHRQKLAYLNFP